MEAAYLIIPAQPHHSASSDHCSLWDLIGQCCYATSHGYVTLTPTSLIMLDHMHNYVCGCVACCSPELPIMDCGTQLLEVNVVQLLQNPCVTQLQSNHFRCAHCPAFLICLDTFLRVCMHLWVRIWKSKRLTGNGFVL